MIYKVIGHKSPDTDTVCSAIAYAWLLSERLGQEAQAYVAGSLNKETQYLLNRFDFPTPPMLEKFTPEDHLVIVDTNNPDELLVGINEASIEEIVDHHKLVGGLHTDHPIKVRIMPIACTATVIYEIAKESGRLDFDKKIASIMLGCILSDTLKFSSPTTTELDKSVASALAEIAGVDIETLAEEMFAAKSDLSGMSVSDILKVDSKVFSFGEKKARIAVLETTKPENALSLLSEIQSTMRQNKSDDRVDFSFFFVVDIIKSEATLIVADEIEKSIAEKAFGAMFAGDTLILPGIVSRKKQITPTLEKAIMGN